MEIFKQKLDNINAVNFCKNKCISLSFSYINWFLS